MSDKDNAPRSEFADFLDEIKPSLEESVGKLGVAGHVGTRPVLLDPNKIIIAWPELSDRIIEEIR